MRPFLVWCTSQDQSIADAVRIDALCSEEAAEKWAELDDSESGDYQIVSGHQAIVSVQNQQGEIFKFTVSGYSSPCYSAELTD